MGNPFKELFDSEHQPNSQAEKELMENIQFKGFLLGIIEFFSALFGWVMISSGPSDDNLQAPPHN